ncbi:hypothetical protein ABGV43_17360 [Paenibacillus amylolyticus]|uniref:hypothetical protein n=1 Tax=Paenibacillus amylolyticus TaxID=1451 RepID=UPI003242DB37
MGAAGSHYEPDTFDASSTLKLNIKKNYNATKVPPGFDHANNAATAKRLGIEANETAKLARNSNNSSSLNINQEIKKEGDYYVGEGGLGNLLLKGRNIISQLIVLTSLMLNWKMAKIC